MKARPARRPRPKVSEKDLVRETVSEATGVHFEVVPPHPAFPLPVEKLDWFMRCRDKNEIASAPYLNVAWKERGGAVWMESLVVGDTVDWIEIAYGDEKAGQSLDIDYSRFDDPAFQDDFKMRFPIVIGRIREYEEAVAAVAGGTKTKLELRRSGTKGMLVFTVAAKVEVRKGASQETLRSAVRKNAAALKEAYEKIQRLYD